MATNERKYPGSLTLGKLEIGLETGEQWFGALKKLEVLGDFTIATFNNDDDDYPPVSTLLLLTRADNQAGSAHSGSTHLFDGEARVVGSKMGVSVYRTS
jgi:hypothetical protein